MLNTDLRGFWENVKDNKTLHLIIIVIILIILYFVMSRYMDKQRNDFINIMLQGNTVGCKGDIPKIDEAIIRSMIELPNRNPAMLTSSMVIPEPAPINDETRRRTRMDILNMFYDSFDDDAVSISSRPKGLFIVP
jgi:hypothetical protein